jgi:hypothetical protein
MSRPSIRAWRNVDSPVRPTLPSTGGRIFELSPRIFGVSVVFQIGDVLVVFDVDVSVLLNDAVLTTNDCPTVVVDADVKNRQVGVTAFDERGQAAATG